MASPTDDKKAGPVEVDLDPAFCDEIRGLAESLASMNYYEVLSIEPSAVPQDVRDAFFQKSRRFHPDRFFRKELGPYGPLLHEIYKRIVAAHDVLRDAELRSGYDRGLGISRVEGALAAPRRDAEEDAERAPSPEAAPEVAPEAAAQPAPAEAESERRQRPSARPRRKGPSLRARRGLRSKELLLRDLEGRLASARLKAQRRFDEAIEYEKRGNWVQAAQLLKLALAFSPRERRYAEKLENLLPHANEERARELRNKAEILIEHDDSWKALELLTECVDLEPMDAELAHRVATMIRDLGGDLKRGIELASRAVSLDERSVPFRKTLAQLYQAGGDRESARREFQRVWQADPLDSEAKAALERL